MNSSSAMEVEVNGVAGTSGIAVWEHTPSFPFTSVSVGHIFSDGNSNVKVLVGSTDGRVFVYRGKEQEEVLESKGGAIQVMLLKDITQFGGVDLLVGDAEGTLVLFSNHEIFSRLVKFCEPITALAFDPVTLSVVVGDRSGTLSYYQPPGHQHHSHIRFYICDLPSLKKCCAED